MTDDGYRRQSPEKEPGYEERRVVNAQTLQEHDGTSSHTRLWQDDKGDDIPDDTQDGYGRCKNSVHVAQSTVENQMVCRKFRSIARQGDCGVVLPANVRASGKYFCHPSTWYPFVTVIEVSLVSTVTSLSREVTLWVYCFWAV